MKKKNYDEIFSKQRDLQDGLDFNDIKENVEVEEKTKVNFIKYLVPIFAFVVLISILTVGLIYLNNKQDFINTEYKEAISFFEDNQLDYSELTRSEVIDVHKDVVTNSFKLKVTSYVIKKAVEKTIKISDEIDDPDSDTTRDYWEYFIELHKKKKEKSGDYYDFLSIHENTEKGTMIFTGVVFTKYNNDETIWSIKFDYRALSYVEVDGYILVYGSSLEFPNDTGFISKVTSNGEVLWTSSIDEAKGISLIKEIDNKYLGLSTFNGSILKMFYITYDGEINLFNTVDFTPRRIT